MLGPVIEFVALAVTTAAVLALLILRDRSRDTLLAGRLAAFDAERLEWTRERQELVTRVLAPQLLPVPLPATAHQSASADRSEPGEPDPWDLIGSIQTGDGS